MLCNYSTSYSVLWCSTLYFGYTGSSWSFVLPCFHVPFPCSVCVYIYFCELSLKMRTTHFHSELAAIQNAKTTIEGKSEHSSREEGRRARGRRERESGDKRVRKSRKVQTCRLDVSMCWVVVACVM